MNGWTFLLRVVSLVAGVAAASDKLSAKEPAKRVVGWVLVTCLAATLIISGIIDYRTWRVAETFRDFVSPEHEVRQVDEASGAAVMNRRAYVVHDDDSKVALFELSNEHENRWNFVKTLPLKDERRDEEKKKLPPQDDKIIKVEKANNLEAAAESGGLLYLATSHSKTKLGEPKAKRELFLEVDVGNGETAAIKRAVNLKDAINRTIHDFVEENGEKWPGGLERSTHDNLELEGLAIDRQTDDGDGPFAYLGFREPLLESKSSGSRYAIVLRAPLKRLFDKNPDMELFLLPLRGSEGYCGITSLEYEDSNRILVLGNSPDRNEFWHAALWRWDVNKDKTVQEVVQIGGEFLHLPEGVRAKAEAVIAPDGDDCVFFFLDAPGHGGQRFLPRAKLNLGSKGG